MKKKDKKIEKPEEIEEVKVVSTADHAKEAKKEVKEEMELEKGFEFDYLLWISISVVIVAYAAQFFLGGYLSDVVFVGDFVGTIFELINRMWWGLLLGVFFVGLLDFIPQKIIMGILGRGGSLSGILRATGAGVLLDMCSHGILLVGMKLYNRGASIGQTVAFLIASPWNSLSLTLILWSLIGLKWTLVFLATSMLIGILTGWILDKLVQVKVLPKNHNSFELKKDFKLWKAVKEEAKKIKISGKGVVKLMRKGFKGSTMTLRWIFFGLVLAALARMLLTPETFQTFFGPTLFGLASTVFVATILEVCSEGSTPIAAELLTRAKAPGNSFAFLMTGVATDYTEMLAIKENTKSWKIAWFLPLITLPQVIVIALLMNGAGV